MFRKSLGLVSFFGGLVLLAACGDDDPPAAKYPTSESFCGAKAAAECKPVAAACTVSEDTCKIARANACNVAAGQATAQGRTYRSGNAEACIEKTTAVYETRVIDSVKLAAFEEACERVFNGAKTKSDRCASAYDCEGSLVCDLDKGFCADRVTKKLKDPCNNPGDICDAGLFCEGQPGAKFCATKIAVGGACSPPALPCAEDLRCATSICVALQEAGQVCQADDECKTGFCNPDEKCQARQYASETGTCKDFGGS